MHIGWVALTFIAVSSAIFGATVQAMTVQTAPGDWLAFSGNLIGGLIGGFVGAGGAYYGVRLTILSTARTGAREQRRIRRLESDTIIRALGEELVVIAIDLSEARRNWDRLRAGADDLVVLGLRACRPPKPVVFLGLVQTIHRAEPDKVTDLVLLYARLQVLETHISAYDHADATMIVPRAAVILLDVTIKSVCNQAAACMRSFGYSDFTIADTEEGREIVYRADDVLRKGMSAKPVA
jgi:hypothetical protein